MKIRCLLFAVFLFIPTVCFAESFHSAEALAESGDSRAMGRLGFMYMTGQGVAQNYGQALSWYQKAADNGNYNAMAKIAWMYENGKGVTQNYREALNWYQKAANHGDSLGMYMLGSIYENGKGVSQDYVVSYMWYNISSSLGNTNAAKSRDNLLPKMTSSQIEEGQEFTREWLAKHPSLQ